MLPRIQDLETVAYLEEFFIWGVRHGVGNKRQGVERQELCGLAQGRPFGLQEGFEIRNPFIQVLFVLQGREDVWDLRLDASSPVHLSSPQGSLGSSHVAAILLAWAGLRAVCSHPNITPFHPFMKLPGISENCMYTIYSPSTAFSLYHYHFLISLNSSTSFLMAWQNLILWVYHNLFNQSPIIRYVHRFHSTDRKKYLSAFLWFP